MRAVIIDDEQSFAVTLAERLSLRGVTAEAVFSAAEARKSLSAAPPDIVFLDVRLGGDDGLALLPELHARQPDVDVIMLTGVTDMDAALLALRRGARNWLKKPVRLEDVLNECRKTGERIDQRRRQRRMMELDRLRLLGRVAEGVAHEVNNPLNIIMQAAGNVRDVLEAAGGRTEGDSRTVVPQTGSVNSAEAAASGHTRETAKTAAPAGGGKRTCGAESAPAEADAALALLDAAGENRAKTAEGAEKSADVGVGKAGRSSTAAPALPERLAALLPEVLEDLRLIHSQSLRVRDMMRRLLLVGGGLDAGAAAVDTTALARGVAAAFAARLAAQGVLCHVDLPAALPRPVWFAQELAQVLRHLWENALDAMPQGGSLRLWAELAQGASLGVPASFPAMAAPAEWAQAEMVQGENVLLLHLDDTGGGIAPDILPNIFEPFFTTKDKGQGLGLAVCQSLMHMRGGDISAENIPAGARFTLLIPLAG